MWSKYLTIAKKGTDKNERTSSWSPGWNVLIRWLVTGDCDAEGPVAGQLPSAAGVPGWTTFIWPRAWPHTSAEPALGFLCILWNSEWWLQVHLTREEGRWEQNIKLNTVAASQLRTASPTRPTISTATRRSGPVIQEVSSVSPMQETNDCKATLWWPCRATAEGISFKELKKKPWLVLLEWLQERGLQIHHESDSLEDFNSHSCTNSQQDPAKGARPATSREARKSYELPGIFLLLALLSTPRTVYQRRHRGANYVRHDWIKVSLWRVAMCRIIEHKGSNRKWQSRGSTWGDCVYCGWTKMENLTFCRLRGH